MLAGAIVAWTLIAWGGRIGLLVGGEDLWAWARIGGSIAVALVLAGLLVFAPSARSTTWGLLAFSAWTVAIWSRSLVVNWMGSGSMSFKFVHTVLGAGFLVLAWWSGRAAARKLGRAP